MAVYEASRPVPFTSIAAFRVVQFFESQLETLRTWIEARQTERVLSALSDHELNDIGLIRGEIETVSRMMSMR